MMLLILSNEFYYINNIFYPMPYTKFCVNLASLVLFNSFLFLGNSSALISGLEPVDIMSNIKETLTIKGPHSKQYDIPKELIYQYIVFFKKFSPNRLGYYLTVFE